MLAFSNIVGQSHAVDSLRRAIGAGKLAHAFLFSGPRGVGKASTAAALAAALNCERSPGEGCGSCPPCAKLAAGQHPDFITLAPEGTFIRVDQVRALEHPLAFAPHEGGHRVVVIDGAESLHPSAANALLKSVEEPRPGTIFVLVTAAPHRVVATLVSRCQRLRFAPLPPQLLLDVVQRAPEAGDQTPETLQQLVAIAEGSPGRALQLLGSEELVQARSVADHLQEALASDDARTMFRAVGECGRDRGALLEALELMQIRLRDLLLAVAGLAQQRLIGSVDIERIEAEAARVGPAAILEQLETVRAARDALEGNANAALTLETLVLAMRRARKRR